MSMDPTQGAQIPAELIAMYSEAELQLLQMMVAAIVSGIDSPDWLANQSAEMLRFRAQAQELAARLQASMPAMINAALDEASAAGVAGADKDADDIPDALPAPARPGRNNTRAKAEAWSTLSQFTQRLPGAAEELYREVTMQVQVRNKEIARPGVRTGALHGAVTPEGTRLDAAQQALDALTKRGITGFKDARGRNWSLTSYIEMKSRTIVNQELIDSHTDRLLERGQSLIVVSSHRNPSPQCQKYEGQVLSLDGSKGWVIRPSAVADKGVRVFVKATLAEARAAGFQHPNCKHAVSGYVAGASATFKTKPQTAGYEATQKQRAMERAIRDTKRQQMVAVTPAAKREATARLRAQQAALKAHLNEWDLKRRPNREKASGAR